MMNDLVHATGDNTVRIVRAVIAGEYCGKDGCGACEAKVEAAAGRAVRLRLKLELRRCVRFYLEASEGLKFQYFINVL